MKGTEGESGTERREGQMEETKKEEGNREKEIEIGRSEGGMKEKTMEQRGKLE